VNTHRPWRAASRAGLVLLAASCAISRRQEIDIGQTYARQIDAQLPVVRSPEVAYLGVLGDSLARLTGTRDLQWRFTLVNSAEVNAFALPGGFVYVTRGLVERTERLDHLAGVVAHEISHVTRRHAVKQMEAVQRANVGLSLACVLTGVCESTVTQVGIELGGAAIFAKYSRDDERQADEDAVRLVARAGISPEGMPEFLQKLLDERKYRPGGVNAWFRTHPYEEDRIAYTTRLIRTTDPGVLAGLAHDSPRYQDFRQRVCALPAPKDKR
jgi:predicted Zn-dependent protease